MYKRRRERRFEFARRIAIYRYSAGALGQGDRSIDSFAKSPKSCIEGVVVEPGGTIYMLVFLLCRHGLGGYDDLAVRVPTIHPHEASERQDGFA